MNYDLGNSFGYDQINISTPLYYNKNDSDLLLRDRNHPENEVKKHLVKNKKDDDESAFKYYLRKNIKKEVEKYELKKEKYTGENMNNAPHYAGYPVCKAHTQEEGFHEGPCAACRGGGVMDFQKKYDNILFIILVVVVAFCFVQYSNIQILKNEIKEIINPSNAIP